MCSHLILVIISIFTGKEEQLKFEWLVTPWSKCSQTCGGSGFQVRAAQCIVRLNDNVTRSVDSSLCSAEDAGLLTSDGRPPTTVQKCGKNIKFFKTTYSCEY